MPNDYHNRQVTDMHNPTSGSGVKPLPAGKPDLSMPVRTANWPGLPGKGGPERSAGVPRPKTHPAKEGF
jgi:hypothetical protein